MKSPTFAILALFAAVAVLTLTPLAMLIYGSFHSAPPGGGGELSGDGWRALLSRGTARVIFDTVNISLLKTAIALGIALLLAWIVVRTDTPGRATLEFLITLPFFIPQILTALAWAMLGAPNGGLINLGWTNLTGSESPLVNVYSYGGVVWHMTQYAIPFLFMLIAAGLRSMDPALEESSRMSGASAWTTYRRITLGVMLPVITGAFLLSFVRGLDGFESAVFFGTPAGVELITTQIYQLINFRNTPDYAQASALSLVTALLMCGLIAGQWALLGRRSYRTITGRGYAVRVASLGRWRWATFSLAVLFVVVIVALPVAQLMLGSVTRFFGFYSAEMLTLDHWRNVLDNAQLWRAARNSFWLAALSAAIALLLGALIAYAIARTKSPLRHALEVVAWIPWMLPGMVLAVGFLWAMTVLPGPFRLYGTPWALLVAYVTLGLPLSVRTMIGAFTQIGDELEESSRVHGAGWTRTFVRILLPLTWPALTAGWMIVFFMGLRELGASVLLYSPGNEVLPVVILRLWSDGRAEEVSVIAILMLALVLGLRVAEHWLVRRREPETDGVPDVPAKRQEVTHATA